MSASHKKNRDKEVLVSKLEKAQDLYVEGELTKADYSLIKARYSEQIQLILASENSLKSVESKSCKKHFEWGFGFTENLSKYYHQSDVSGKREIIGSMFPDNFYFFKNRVRTNSVSEVYKLICTGSKGLKRIKKPNNSKKSIVSGLVLEAGVEPARAQCPQDFKFVIVQF